MNLQSQLETAVREYVGHPSRIRRLYKVIDRLLTKAEDGNVAAAKLLLDKIVPNARDEGDKGGDGQKTYVFRIENATFAAPPLPKVVEAGVITVKEDIH